MSIEKLGEIFKVVNPNGGMNPDGNCMHSAVETARALVMGRNPREVDGNIGSVGGNGHDRTQEFPLGMPARAKAVLQWLLTVAEPGGVYAVDGGGHAYNFLVGYDRRIFLFDSNQHIFRRIITTADFVAVGHNDNWMDSHAYNYGNPDGGDDDEPLVLYYWGPLANRYATVLRDSRVLIGKTLSGAHELL